MYMYKMFKKIVWYIIDFLKVETKDCRQEKKNKIDSLTVSGQRP